MAISDEPQFVGSGAIRNASTISHSSVLRRRHSSGLFDSSATVESESSSEESVEDSGSDDSVSSNRHNDVKFEQNRVPDISDVKFAYRPSVPAHRRIKESPLSSDNIFRQLQSHAGLFNLCIVVLVAVNSRLIIENLMKYGWLIKSGFWFSSKSLRDWPLFMCCLTLAIFPFAAFAVEKLAQQKSISEPVVILLHVINATAAVLYPILVILRCDSAFQSGVTLMLFACVVWLKLVSYAHTNYDLRALTNSIEKGEELPNTLNMDYPYDVSFKSLVYFMVAPTLCYQVTAWSTYFMFECNCFQLVIVASFGLTYFSDICIQFSFIRLLIGTTIWTYKYIFSTMDYGVWNMFEVFTLSLVKIYHAQILPGNEFSFNK